MECPICEKRGYSIGGELQEHLKKHTQREILDKLIEFHSEVRLWRKNGVIK